MKAHRLAMLVGAPMLLVGTAHAGFTGIEVVGKPNPYGLLVCNVFATFDRPGQDLFIQAIGTPGSPMDISVIGGTFYQHPFGGDTAPPNALPVCGKFPSLVFDTFVTVGLKCHIGVDDTTLGPGWPGFGAASLETDSSGWSVPVDSPQADPFNPDYLNGNGEVLIGQFSTLNGTAISGMFRIVVVSNNVSTQLDVSFFHVPAPGALAFLATCGLVVSRRRRRPRFRPRAEGLEPPTLGSEDRRSVRLSYARSLQDISFARSPAGGDGAASLSRGASPARRARSRSRGNRSPSCPSASTSGSRRPGPGRASWAAYRDVAGGRSLA